MEPGEADISPSDAPRAHKRIDVVEAVDSLSITLPRRRTGRTNAIAAVAMMPFGYSILKLVVMLGVVMPGMDSWEEFLELLSVVAIAVSVGLLVNFYAIFGVIVGAYLLWGSTRVEVSSRKIVVKMVLGKTGIYFSGVELSSATPGICVAQDQRGRAYVEVLPIAESKVTSQKKLVFGAGDLSVSQAQRLVAAISEFLERSRDKSSRIQQAHRADGES